MARPSIPGMDPQRKKRMDVSEQLKQVSDLMAGGRVSEAQSVMQTIANHETMLSGPAERGNVWFGLGALHSMLGDQDSAMAAFLKASAAFEEANDHHRVAEVTRRVAEVLATTNRTPEAELFAQKYLTLAEALQDPAMYLDAAMQLWTMFGLLGRKVEATRLMEKVRAANWLQQTPRSLQDFMYLTRGVDRLHPQFAEEVARSGNERLLGYLYLERGSECVKARTPHKAASWFEKARELACRLPDLQMYFYSIAGLLVVYSLEDRKLKCMETLMKGATTLRAILGPEVMGSFHFLYESLRATWGSEVFDQVLEQFRNKSGLTQKGPQTPGGPGNGSPQGD